MSHSINRRIGVSLDELFPQATRSGTGEVRVTSCTSDWRKIEPGDVFVALDDLAGDGHCHARRAVSHGAAAVVCEQPVPVFDVPTYLVPDSRVAFGELCHELVDAPTRSLPTIGVTGTLGKSTTLAGLDSIFSQAGKHCGTISSLGCYDGMTHSAGISEAPTSPAIASRLARMVASGCTHALIEVSSCMLSQARLAGMQLDAVCVTNVTEAHLDLHNSLQSYRDVKRRILDYLSPTGMTVLNADDPVSLGWLNRLAGPVLTYGLGDQAEVTARIIERHANEQLFVLTAGSESAAVRTPMVGEHHVSNCLAAATVALSFGIDLQAIAAGIEMVEQLPGRMERVDRGQGFPVYVDAADTPQALHASLRTARQLARGRVICVLGDKTNASPSEDYAVSHVVRRLADLAIAARPLAEIDGNASGDKLQADDFHVVSDRGEAIAWAVSIAEPGDVVVIAGSQTRPQCGFGSIDGANNDAEIARQLLDARNEVLLRLVA